MKCRKEIRLGCGFCIWREIAQLMVIADIDTLFLQQDFTNLLEWRAFLSFAE